MQVFFTAALLNTQAKKLQQCRLAVLNRISKVQVSDTTGDAMKYFGRVQKKSLLPTIYIKFGWAQR